MNHRVQRSKKVLAALLSLVLVLGHFLGSHIFAIPNAAAQAEGEVIFSLADDTVIQNLEVGAFHQPGFWDHTPFQGAGSPLFTIVGHPESGNSIQISDRAADWHALDIRRADIGIVEGYDYRVIVEGRVPDAPTNTTVILGGADGPHRWLGDAIPATDGTFSMMLDSDHDYFWGEAGGAQDRFRFQTNNQATFIIDDIIVIRLGESEQPLGNYSTYWSLDGWLEEQGFEPGNVLPWTADTVVRNSGSNLIVEPNGSVEITDRDADWNGMDVRFELYPGDRIELSGRIPTPVPTGMEVRLQRLPGYGNFDTFPVAADGTFTVIHVVTEAQATGSEGFRINSNATGANADMLIESLTVYRLDDAEPVEPPPVEIPPVDLPVLDESHLGNYALKVEIPAGNQWDGLRLNRAAFESYLTAGGTYEFSFDLFTPQSPAGVGLMLQTNGPRWAHLIVTPNYPADSALHWTRFNSELQFEGRPNIVNPANILSYEWGELQLVKRGSGTGGVHDGSMVVFFIDNFTITNTATGEVVWIHDFEGGFGSHAPFVGSPTSVDLQVVPISEVGSVDMSVPEFDLSLPSLARDCFDDAPFLFGNIWSTESNMSIPNTESFFLNQFNAVTAENHHKPDQIAPSPNPATWNFTTADLIVDWAEENDLAMIGHTLVWHSQSPLWMTGRVGHETLPLVTRAQAIENMSNFISIYAGRYAGRIYSWDVLNEVFTDSVSLEAWEANPNWRAHLRREGVGLSNPNYLRWYDAFANGATGDEEGADFIFYAFYFARQADPNAILYYNDFNEEQPGKSRAIAQMVVEINERWAAHPSYDGRLLIEVIGMQSHHHLDQWVTNLDNIRPAMIRFIETGARISVTELDITIGGNGQGTNPQPLPRPLPEADQQRLAAAYGRVMGYYLEFAEHMNRVSIWGLADTQSWRAWGQPLLFDGNFQAKPAFWAVCNAVANGGVEPPVLELEYEWQGGNTFTLGTETPLVLVIENRDVDDFVALRVHDDLLVQDVSYTVERGSVRMTLLPEYLSTLPIGTYGVEVLLANGETLETYLVVVDGEETPEPPCEEDCDDEKAETRPTLPQTGATVTSLAILGGIALATAGVISSKKKKIE